ncbi:hypothetical protein IGI04_017277 [Brassica rapa subsp. trilocularis]|uniref:RNase H type-1 domain-containing protein n=1 Tax=Brassica rapa subsp. trilocularis TaxID=1813537 RepID=A0ABQ7M9K4_BRACM|nr:hypothetical protein IGI04_017277 [Brassica rapa subsp. trilocularis]
MLATSSRFAWIIDDVPGTSTPHSTTSPFVALPLIAETLALPNAMISAHSCGIKSLSIFSDSQVLIKLVKSKGKHLEIAGLFNNIYFLSYRFTAIEFMFIPRLANARAYYVAKHTLSLMYQNQV